MKAFWFIRKYMVLIGVIATVYVAADQLAATSIAISHETAVQTAKLEQSKAEIHSRIVANHDLLKRAGAFDGQTTIISQASR